jgi:hypothetical protein
MSSAKGPQIREFVDNDQQTGVKLKGSQASLPLIASQAQVQPSHTEISAGILGIPEPRGNRCQQAIDKPIDKLSLNGTPKAEE